MYFIDENGNKKLINDTFDYHGVEFVTVRDNRNMLTVYEPAYGVEVKTGKYDQLFSLNNKLDEIAKDIDQRANYKESCEFEKNYLGEIALDVIKNDKHVKNKSFNQKFVEKLETLRKQVLEKSKKGIAIGIAFAACACFAPKLAAQQNNFSISSTTIEHGTLYDNLVGEPKQQAVKDTIDILNIIEQAKADNIITNDELNMINSRINSFNENYGKASFSAVSEGILEAKKEVKAAFGKEVKLQDVAETAVRKAANTQKNVKAMHRSLEDIYPGR